VRFVLANNHCISDPTTGDTHSLLTIMRWLAQAGHQCHVLTTARFETPVTFTIEEHLSELGVAVEQVTTGGTPAVRYTINDVPVTLLLTRHHDEAKPDPDEARDYLGLFERLRNEFAPDQMIACSAHPMIRLALEAAQESGITTVFTLRAPGYFDRRYFESVDHVFTNGQYLTDLYFERIGLTSTPLHSPIVWSNVLAPTESRAFVTFVNPALHKGLMLFARLADMLGSRRPDIPVLVVQSGSGGFLNNISELDFSRYPQIMAAPPVRTPAEYFALTRILLVPSLIESFGRVAVEAMINGIPAVVGNRGALAGVIGGDFSEGGGGRVVPIPDWMVPNGLELPSETEIEPWFEAVCQLWDDTVLYNRVSTRARQIAEGRYSEEVSRTMHLDYLMSLKPGGRLFSGLPDLGK